MCAAIESRFRLYLDESGDHVHRITDELYHRFLCLLGCWFEHSKYVRFSRELEDLKYQFFSHDPDEPIILHREEILNARGAFRFLQNDAKRREFDDALLATMDAAEFKIVAVVIDKKALIDAYGDSAAHPYHLGLGFLLQRYAGYLNHTGRRGDVMAESRGGREDRLLKESYERIYERGAWRFSSAAIQSALTSKQLKLKQKSANIAGLQLADLLGHPIKNYMLRQAGFLTENLPPFATKVVTVAASKFNRHLYDGRIDGYGTVLFPRTLGQK